MVSGHSMGPGLQLVGAQFFNFLLGKLSREFKLRRLSIFHQIQMNVRISVVRDATVTCLGMLVVLHVLCQGQGQGHGPSELQTIAHKCTFPGISPPPLSRGAQN